MGKRKGPKGIGAFSKDWSFATTAELPNPSVTRSGTDLAESQEVEEIVVNQPPSKKRKVVPVSRTEQEVGLLGPGWERYDATGLVPHYTKSKQVPPSLRKCTSMLFSPSIVAISFTYKILHRGRDIFPCIMKDVYLTRKGGIVSLQRKWHYKLRSGVDVTLL